MGGHSSSYLNARVHSVDGMVPSLKPLPAKFADVLNQLTQSHHTAPQSRDVRRSLQHRHQSNHVQRAESIEVVWEVAAQHVPAQGNLTAPEGTQTVHCGMIDCARRCCTHLTLQYREPLTHVMPCQPDAHGSVLMFHLAFHLAPLVAV